MKVIDHMKTTNQIDSSDYENDDDEQYEEVGEYDDEDEGDALPQSNGGG